jgi:hypothetical protein
MSSRSTPTSSSASDRSLPPARWAAAGVAVLALASADPAALAVERAGGWHQWWRADRAPAAWPAGDAVVASAVRWRPAAAGMEVGELRLSGSGEAWRIRAIVVRLDPAALRFRLESPAPVAGSPNQWSLRSAPDSAVLALNAGQFGAAGAWGWVVRDGIERQPPRSGPLAPAVLVGRDGRLRIVPADSIAAAREANDAELAFQSYPALLEGDGTVPEALRSPGHGVDLQHRDSRLAIGELRDGRVLILLTRFEGLGGVLDNLPFGLTTPETAALMGALGCRRAVLLDGGISSQLAVRDAAGGLRAWRGMRYVPLGLVARVR